MTAKHRIVHNMYKDSVALMAISSKLLAIDGLETASVVMATPTNLENLVEAGLGDDLDTKPSDLVVAVAGTDDACDAALTLADELLAEQPVSDGGNVAEQPMTSIQMAVARDPALNFALVSVPGTYAAAEAIKAIRLGMSVMVFSDNVPVAEELAMKQLADERGLMVMGPDCGTAIVNGLPLGFANVVRRGSIGVVGASGTGMQEVTARIHNLGAGVSQALGTGGHDLSDDIGGISMLHGLRALDADAATAVIVLVSKPPAQRVAAAVLDEARRMSTPVVVIFLGQDPATFSDEYVHGASTLAGAADLAVALAGGEALPDDEAKVSADARGRLDDGARRMAASQRYVRGIFCGGTFCFEAQLLCQREGIDSWSNAPVAGNKMLDDIRVSTEHTIVDMGDDEFTQGRPHPMIDPALRDERVANEADDPSTAVILLDVVLGYGSADDPVGGLIGALGRARSNAKAAGRHLTVIAHVCGTDADPQNRSDIIAKLESTGALVARTNAEAALWAAHVANRLAAR
ncbi:MAG TPA: acyl-CoA synthetase FdrA [Ilumatobacteraceae bacterium]|nr:acyl-CoA synthetase FdrA [Ilumatobacteraceae bacterium]